MTTHKEVLQKVADGVGGGDREGILYALRHRQIAIPLAPVTASPTMKYALYYCEKVVTVKRFTVVCGAAVATAAANAVSQQLTYDDGITPGSTDISTAMTTLSSGGVAYAKDVAKVFTGITDADVIPAGSTIYLEDTIQAAGVDLPQRTCFLIVEEGTE